MKAIALVGVRVGFPAARQIKQFRRLVYLLPLLEKIDPKVPLTVPMGRTEEYSDMNQLLLSQ